MLHGYTAFHVYSTLGPLSCALLRARRVAVAYGDGVVCGIRALWTVPVRFAELCIHNCILHMQE